MLGSVEHAALWIPPGLEATISSLPDVKVWNGADNRHSRLYHYRGDWLIAPILMPSHVDPRSIWVVGDRAARLVRRAGRSVDADVRLDGRNRLLMVTMDAAFEDRQPEALKRFVLSEE